MPPHDLLMRGRFDLQPATTEAVKRAEADFQQAIDIDPNYAEAYLGLACRAGESGDAIRLGLEYSRARASIGAYGSSECEG